MGEKDFEDMVKKRLISVVPIGIRTAKLLSQVSIKFYTREQKTPDIWAGWLRLYRRN